MSLCAVQVYIGKLKYWIWQLWGLFNRNPDEILRYLNDSYNLIPTMSGNSCQTHLNEEILNKKRLIVAIFNWGQMFFQLMMVIPGDFFCLGLRCCWCPANRFQRCSQRPYASTEYSRQDPQQRNLLSGNFSSAEFVWLIFKIYYK